MGSPKPREQRQVVFVTCRMRDDSGWSDMTICNLSSRGLMGKCSAPPPRGAFVEVRRGGVSMVGQVRWSQDGRIGIRTQEHIDVPALLDQKIAAKKVSETDRRSRERNGYGVRAKPTQAALEERSRRWARRFEWIVVASVGIVSAGLLAAQVHSMMVVPLERAKAAMVR